MSDISTTICYVAALRCVVGQWAQQTPTPVSGTQFLEISPKCFPESVVIWQ